MIFPLVEYSFFGVDFSLILSLFLGFGFGFFLEQAGLGNAKKLVAQFYLKDLTVFKVMFTAIITAMLGLFFLEYAGYLNTTLITFTDTYLVPQITGGLILGFGFIIGGYCPGTCVIGMSSGSKDALPFFIGLFIGMIIFSLSYPLLESFFLSSHLGDASLQAMFGLEKGSMIFVIVHLAILAFYFSEKIESKHAKK